MPVSMLELFRTLSSFAPERAELSSAPWERYVDWAIAQGLAPLAAYNLEYRLGGAGSPEWARDRLLSIYQGSANDNVMKLVNFKRSIDELEGRRVVVVGAASFAESLYPHVAFRPVIDVRVYLPKADVEPFANWLRRAEFRPDPDQPDPEGADRVLSDSRTLVFLHGSMTGDAAEDEGLLARAVPMKVYGPSAYRLDLEDAILVQSLLLARAGFEVPMLEYVDLRELVLGAPSMGGIYSRAVDVEPLHRRARAWKIDKALWASLSIVGRLFPDAAEAARRLLPDVSFPVRELLERLVVAPVADVERAQAFRGEDTLRSLLAR